MTRKLGTECIEGAAQYFRFVVYVSLIVRFWLLNFSLAPVLFDQVFGSKGIDR